MAIGLAVMAGAHRFLVVHIASGIVALALGPLARY